MTGQEEMGCTDSWHISRTAPLVHLSSPRAKRAGPKGLRAESARAVTVRQCCIVGWGKTF